MNSGEITGLDFMLARINSIESNFNRLLTEKKPDVFDAGKEFKEILDNSISTLDEAEAPTIAKAKGHFNIDKTQSRSRIEDLIEKHSQKHGIDPDFVRAVVKQESGFNPLATSKAGAMGLMQLMPGTARGLGVWDAYDVEQNIDGGVRYLKSMMNKFNQDSKLALAAYNAGPGAVQKYGGIPPYSETQNYVRSVMASYSRMKDEG